MTPHPKLRGDLTTSCQDTDNGVVFVLKDPLSERFFRLRDHEYRVAQQLDGHTDLESVRRNVQERFGQPVYPDSIERFVRRLDELRLLEREGSHPPPPCPRRRGTLLYLRFKTFDPDWLLSRTVKPLRFFFTPGFVALSAAVVLLALGIAASNTAEIWLHLRRLYRLDALPVVWVCVLGVTVLHEFAHGLTCKYFGGRVREMGLMLIYFQPAMYCNVSDAWLFPERSRRLWVTFAGGYFEVFLWALATIAWRITNPETTVNFVALIVMATSGVKFAFNANPLIKLDGYYLLSDYLAIPNLRQRSFAYIRARMRQLFRRGSQPPDATSREQRIYIVYGLLAILYSAWLLAWVSWHVGGYLIDRYKGVGLLVFLLLMSLVFKPGIGGRLSRIAGMVRGSEGPKTERRRHWQVYAVPAIAVASLALAVPGELRVNGSFTILPAHNADVRAQIEGIVEEVHVEEGDFVVKGRLLARLSDKDQSAQLGALDGAIQEKQARLKLLRAGPRREEVDLARAEVSTAGTRKSHAEQRYEEAMRLQAARRSSAQWTVKATEERLAYAETEFARFNELFLRGLVSRSQIEERQQQIRLLLNELERTRDGATLATADDTAQLRQEVAVLTKEAEQAEGRLKVLLAGSRREEIEASEAEIAQLMVRRAFLAEQLQMASIRSPADGIVVTARLKEKVGQHVKPGDLIAEVHELKTVAAEIAVSEKDIADVAVNALVWFKARAYPERTFMGRVAAIAPAAITDGELQDRFFRVRVEIDNASDSLKPAMSGTAKISCGKHSLFTIGTRRVARLVRVEFWSWW